MTLAPVRAAGYAGRGVDFAGIRPSWPRPSSFRPRSVHARPGGPSYTSRKV